MTLPLKLVAFERYMLADDRTRHPMTFTVRLKFSGPFDSGAFRAAVRAAVRRHPLLAAHLDDSLPKEPAWVAADDPSAWIDIGSLDKPLEFPGSERIDLRQETGLRIWVRTGEKRTEMRFQFHHSCTDGIGAYRLVEDVLCAYDANVRGDSHQPRFRPLERNRLRQRNRFGLNWRQTALRLPQEVWGAVVGAAMFFARRPASLATAEVPQVDEASRLELLDYPTHSFTEQETRQLRDAARRHRATLNDLLLRDLLLVSYRWNRRLGVARRRSLRVAMPIDLRGPGDDLLPATNAVAMVFLDRIVGWYFGPRHLLWSIKWETSFIKRFRLGLSFIRICKFVSKIPGGLQRLTRADRCYTSAVMSNMGRPLTEAPLPRCEGKLHCGEMILDAIESAPPVRPDTAAGLTAVTYADRLTVVMNYDRFHFTPQAAADFLDTLIRQMKQTAASSAQGRVSSKKSGTQTPGRYPDSLAS